MAPKTKSAEKLVVRSTKKVVESSVQVSVVGNSSSSSKRVTRRRNSEEVGGNGIFKENVRVIPVQQMRDDTITNASTTTTENTQKNYQKQKQKVELVEKKSNTKEKKGRKRGSNKNGEAGYQRYVYKVLKQVHPDMGISAKCMTLLNNFMNDMFERLVCEASRLTDYAGHMTLTSREIQGAVKLVLPGELGKHAIAEGIKAVNNFSSYHA